MAYDQLTDSERIIFAAECVGRGVQIPHEIAAVLGEQLVSEIKNPEPTDDGLNTETG